MIRNALEVRKRTRKARRYVCLCVKTEHEQLQKMPSTEMSYHGSQAMTPCLAISFSFQKNNLSVKVD